MIAVYSEKENLIKKLNKETNLIVKIETTNFDTELTAIDTEYKNKLKALTDEINSNCNHPELMHKWLRNQQIDDEYRNGNAYQTTPSIIMDLKLFDKYLRTIYKLADEYKEQTTQINEWRKRSENVLFTRMRNNIDTVIKNKNMEIKYLEHEKTKWDKKYRVMRSITGYYRNCWMHYLASRDKIERQKIEDEMSNKEILYQIYQNILDRYNAEEEKAKEKLIHDLESKYHHDSPDKSKKDEFHYHTLKHNVVSNSDGNQEIVSNDTTNEFRGTNVIQRLRQHRSQRISATDIVLPQKLLKYAMGNSFFADINNLAGLKHQAKMDAVSEESIEHDSNSSGVFNFEEDLINKMKQTDDIVQETLNIAAPSKEVKETVIKQL